MSDRSGLGIALSGGGNRAALFAIGALIGIKDSLRSVQDEGHSLPIRSIASVSGGSLPNGQLSMSPVSYQDMSTSEVMTTLKPGVKIYARDGLFFPGEGTNLYVATFFFLIGAWISSLITFVTTLIALHRTWHVTNSSWLAGAIVLIVELVVVLFAWAKTKMPARFGAACLLGLALVVVGIPLAVAVPPVRNHQHPLLREIIVIAVAAIVVLALGSLTVAWFGFRSRQVDRALNKRLYDGTLLNQTQEQPRHIFCPTNIQSGRQAYLARDFVYGYELGLGAPAPTLRLSTAVQASACFPGGFRPRRLKASELFADPSQGTSGAFTDGGVYDNMGDQWEFGWSDREHRVGTQACFGTPAQALVVVNAGGFYKEGPLEGTGLPLEVRSLLRSKDVMYAQTTAVKRRYLVDSFEKAGAADLHGVLVHIDQTPSTVPSAFAHTPGFEERAKRAQNFLGLLSNSENEPSAEDWNAIRDANKTTKTVLKALGIERATDLMQHSYTLTRINLYVVLGIGELPDTTSGLTQEVVDVWGRHRFQAYAANGDVSPADTGINSN